MTRLAPLALAAMLCACSRSGQEKTTEKAEQPKPEAPIFHVDPATATTVTGTVRFTGHHPARQKIDISEDPACVKANPGGLYDESLIVSPSGAVANTFVYISKGLEGKNFPKSASEQFVAPSHRMVTSLESANRSTTSLRLPSKKIVPRSMITTRLQSAWRSAI